MANHEKPKEDEDEISFSHLPKQENWWGIFDLYQWQGFWFDPPRLKSAMAMQSHFQSLPNDIILASFPKTGTTWLKALAFSMVTRNSDIRKVDPLLTHNPHQLVPYLERGLYDRGVPQNLSGIPSPRIIATHLPYELLPETIKSSGCRVVYITRNPRDTFVSSWHFSSRFPSQGTIPLETAFESFCTGVTPFGPFFKHGLGYWKERENKVHFIMYEDMKEDTPKQVKKLAEFLGCPLNSEEEIEEIIHKCSYERLSNLEVNKRSQMDHWSGLPPGAFFRRGVVGDWRNYFTPEMIEQLDGLAQIELEGSGLQFKM